MKIFPGILAVGLLASTLYACQRQAVSPGQLFLPRSNLVARSVSSSQIDLSWTDTARNEIFLQLQSANNPLFTQAATRRISPNTTSYSDTGLGPIATYWYRIRTTGPDGSVSDWSNTAFATTAPDGVVATPTVLVIGGQQTPVSSAIDVSWGTPNPPNTNVTGYTVRYSTAGGACKDRAVAGGNGSSTYTATGLVPSKTYSVSVRADGGAYSSAFSAPAHTTTSSDGLSGIRISPLFFGQNAWLPILIGASDDDEENTGGGDLEELLCGTSYASGGELQGGACVTPSVVSESGVKLMRYGGKGVDQYYDADESPAQYLTMVDNMRTNGIEPLLQVPYWDGKYSEQDAAALVRHINVTHDRCVRYWKIANEPDKEYPNDQNIYNLDAAGIADYFKKYVTAMRNVDPTIIIVGPDLHIYDDDIMSELLTGPEASDICGSYTGDDGKTHYYLDIVDFHTYPFSGTQMRQQVLDAVDNFAANLDDLKTLVDQCNTSTDPDRTGTSALKMAVSEIHIEFENDIQENDTVSDHWEGVNAQSFLAGQYWASVMNVGMQNGLEFMAFWSVKEGDPEIGYIAGDDADQVDPHNTKLSTYYHYQMLARNFRGVYPEVTSALTSTGLPDPNVKAFGAKDLDRIVVMLLNQNEATDLTYTVQLNDTAFTSSSALDVAIDAGVNVQYTSPADGPLENQSTVMLVFNATGVLLERRVYALSGEETAGPTVIPGGASSRVAPPERGRRPKPKHRRD